MKTLAFATYWLMVVAVIGGISRYEQERSAESEAVTDAAQYSFNDIDCDAVRRSGQLASAASVQCVR
jgi:hypothetical protein